MNERFSCVVVGGGAAGLSAALNLVRSRHRVLVVDEGRPRNAATMRSHGFLTRDGVAPLELRSLAIAELAQYGDARVLQRARVDRLSQSEDGEGFRVEIATRRDGAQIVDADAVILASGLREELPRIEGLSAFYGMSLFSCIACDAYEHGDQPLVLISETGGTRDRALLLGRFSDHLTVCTNASGALSDEDESLLRSQGIRVDRREIRRLEGQKGSVERIRFEDDTAVDVSGGFVLPRWSASLEFADEIGLDRNESGLVVTDRDGRSSVPFVYAAGDVTMQGPQQLIVAAGAGARAAAVLTHDRLGIVTPH